MGTKVKVTGKTKVNVKKKPIKAGSGYKDNTGGIFTAKVAAIARKRRKKLNKNKNG